MTLTQRCTIPGLFLYSSNAVPTDVIILWSRILNSGTFSIWITFGLVDHQHWHENTNSWGKKIFSILSTQRPSDSERVQVPFSRGSGIQLRLNWRSCKTFRYWPSTQCMKFRFSWELSNKIYRKFRLGSWGKFCIPCSFRHTNLRKCLVIRKTFDWKK